MSVPTISELKSKFREICEMDESPHSIALGAAIGIFVGFQPCMGIQMSIAIPIAFVLRANKLLAAAGVWFTNPLTFIPIYYSAYVTGTWMYPVSPLTLKEFTSLMNNFSWRMLMELGEKTVVPLIAGCLVLGFITGIMTYVVVRVLVAKNRRRKETIPASQQ